MILKEITFNQPIKQKFTYWNETKLITAPLCGVILLRIKNKPSRPNKQDPRKRKRTTNKEKKITILVVSNIATKNKGNNKGVTNSIELHPLIKCSLIASYTGSSLLSNSLPFSQQSLTYYSNSFPTRLPLQNNGSWFRKDTLKHYSFYWMHSISQLIKYLQKYDTNNIEIERIGLSANLTGLGCIASVNNGAELFTSAPKPIHIDLNVNIFETTETTDKTIKLSSSLPTEFCFPNNLKPIIFSPNTQGTNLFDLYNKNVSFPLKPVIKASDELNKPVHLGGLSHGAMYHKPPPLSIHLQSSITQKTSTLTSEIKNSNRVRSLSSPVPLISYKVPDTTQIKIPIPVFIPFLPNKNPFLQTTENETITGDDDTDQNMDEYE